jgi:NAD-dependent DNA ligase
MQKLKGIVCITGKLSSYKTKAEAAKELESRGFAVKSTLTKDVTILVNESGQESAKTKQARDRGLTVIDNLLNFLEN